MRLESRQQAVFKSLLEPAPALLTAQLLEEPVFFQQGAVFARGFPDGVDPFAAQPGGAHDRRFPVGVFGAEQVYRVGVMAARAFGSFEDISLVINYLK